MKQQKGFTLIELIIVIVVLGILAVTAAPQFINFQSDARESTVKGAQASIQGAMQLVYAKSLIDGTDDAAKAAGETVETENGDINISFGYPTALDGTTVDANGIQAAAGLSSTEWTATVEGTTAVRFSPVGASTDCYVEYTEAADASTPASVTVGDLENDC